MPTSEEFYADAKAEFGEVVQPDTHTQDVVDHTTGNSPEYNAYLDEIARMHPIDWAHARWQDKQDDLAD